VVVFVNLLFVLAVSLIIGTMFSVGLRGRNRWAGSFWFFLILFFGSWALGSWLRPIGPPAWDVYWVPYVIAAAVLELLMAAVTPAVPHGLGAEHTEPSGDAAPRTTETEVNAANAVTTLSVFFWLLLGVAIVAIAIHYFTDV
jgi:hypothetical protein